MKHLRSEVKKVIQLKARVISCSFRYQFEVVTRVELLRLQT